MEYAILIKGVFLDMWFSRRNKTHIIECYGQEFSFIIKIRLCHYVLKIISGKWPRLVRINSNFRPLFAAFGAVCQQCKRCSRESLFIMKWQTKLSINQVTAVRKSNSEKSIARLKTTCLKKHPILNEPVNTHVCCESGLIEVRAAESRT